MDGMKRQRFQEGDGSQTNSNIMLQQPLYLNPIVSINGEPYLELDPSQVRDYNPQLNLLYFVMPKDANAAEGFSSMCILPNNQTQGISISTQFNKEIELDSNNKNDVIYIRDDSPVHNPKRQNSLIHCPNDYEQKGNPLEIYEHVNYAMAKPYKEAMCDSPAVNVIKHEFTWKTNIKCDYYPSCKVVLTSQYEKKIHMDDHNYPPSTSFKCSICNMLFPLAIDRNKHVETHSVAERYKCDTCLKRFPYYTTYVQHLREGNCPNTTLACDECGTFFVHEGDLQNHQENDITICLCSTKVCKSDIDLHYNTCLLYKKQIVKKKKKSYSDDVVILD